MGTGVGIKCKNCDYSGEFYLGCGRMNHQAAQLNRDNNVHEYVETDKEKEIIMSLMEHGQVYDHPDPWDLSMRRHIAAFKGEPTDSLTEPVVPERAKDFGYMLCRCGKCGKFYDRFMFTIQTAEHGLYIHDHVCPDCDIPLDILRENVVTKEFPVYSEQKIVLNKDGTNKTEMTEVTEFDFSDFGCPVCGAMSLEEAFFGIRWD